MKNKELAKALTKKLIELSKSLYIKRTRYLLNKITKGE